MSRSAETEFQSVLNDNLEFFKEDVKFASLLRDIEVNIAKCTNRTEIIDQFSNHYCFENIKYNGYRSCIEIYDAAVTKIIENLNSLKKQRSSFFFNFNKFRSEFEDWDKILDFLHMLLDGLIQLHDENNGNDCLFLPPMAMENFLEIDNNFNVDVFCGRFAGFYYTSCMEKFAKSMLSMAACIYQFQINTKDSSSVKYFKSVFSFFGYLMKPNKRAIDSKTAIAYGDIGFLKSFWEFNEHPVPVTIANLLGKKITINEIFHITPKNLNVTKINPDEVFSAPMPMSHIGLKKIQCRLISKKFRRGMLDKLNIDNVNEPSKTLIFYCHGGGFVSQTTVSHEAYLKEIANKLDVPIISIDYSLIPFPRALEEIFYAYCWTLKNSQFLGSTAEKIIIAGDSAGANLATCCIIKCIENGIRSPDNLVNFYGFFNVEFCISPSRVLAAMDPFLPPMIISNILNSYLTGETTVINSKDESKNLRFENYLISPLLTPEKILENFPPTILYTSNFDASLDDNVEFAKKLKKSNVTVQLKVMEKIPHAFLNHIYNSKACLEAFNRCLDDLEQIVN